MNVSEGRDAAILDELGRACGPWLLDLHRDPWHHRAVLTLAGPNPAVEDASKALARQVVRLLDLRTHRGAHPRFGVLDVVPFVPLARRHPAPAPVGAAPVLHLGSELAPAVAARDRFARWAADELGLPCFLYGPLPGGGTRTLPEVRRGAFATIDPDVGPGRPHPTAGAVAVGARPVLVAYNVWLENASLATARAVAAAVRSPAVRALGIDLGGRAQVSCNLVDPVRHGPAEIFDRVVALAGSEGAGARAELVGLVPGAVLRAVPQDRWESLGLAWTETLEARLEQRDGWVSWR